MEKLIQQIEELVAGIKGDISQMNSGNYRGFSSTAKQRTNEIKKASIALKKMIIVNAKKAKAEAKEAKKRGE